jgi:hypothetical protein
MAKNTKILVTIFVILVLGTGGYFLYNKFYSPSTGSGEPVEIPFSILNNKFGFLSGGPEDNSFVTSVGASWLRPHPGPFLWDAMQDTDTANIDFSKTDKLVKETNKADLAVLATLWPFANWDQKKSSNGGKCAVSENDEFLPKSDNKGLGDYLPEYRCAPTNWEAYENWVRQVVERYDGDGQNDMTGLTMPVKYWEVMNEPDLPVTEDGRLVFWLDTPANYAELLVSTYKVIKEADPTASVVIAGAAGGDDKFLNFYKKVFGNSQALASFDVANVHCISNDSFDSFNVEPYKKMLSEFKITKPVWVTEAEAIVTDDTSKNATQTWKSAQKALDLGAEKIFFTRYEFEDKMSGPRLEGVDVEAELDGADPIGVYKRITGTNK